MDHWPILGTQMDLRDDKETLSVLATKGQSPIKKKDAQKLAQKHINTQLYFECSALTQQGLKTVRTKNHLNGLPGRV